jgi:hypothetical protein
MLKLAGRTVIVLDQCFFGMQKVGGESNTDEQEQEYQVEIFFVAVFHNP